MRQYSGSWTLSQVAQAISDQNWPGIAAPNVEYLVVGGGGGGGSAFAGGGGGGGLLTGFCGVTSGSQLWVTVGAGGTAGSAGSTGSTGGTSVFLATSSTATTGTVVATGGGGGGGGSLNGASGASGGGAGGSSSATNSAGSGTSGQGNSGGINFAQSGVGPAGGGGGAGTVGLQAVTSTGGNGGAGIASDISGTRTAYAGGGGGGSVSGTAGSGGAGGGGAGSVTSAAGTAGTANTGGGGGGGSGTSPQAGGAGGSGVVIISYPDTYRAAQATTGSPTITTSGSGSLLFNGTSNYLITSSTQIIPATGDFTIEAWIYPTSFSGNPAIWGQGSGGDSGRSQIYISAGGVPTFTNGNSFSLPATSSISLNTWTYFSFVRSGNTGTFYINSTSAGSGSLAGISIQNTVFTVGGTNPAWTAQYFTGYISNFRVSDVARTISTTPIEPFNASTANTKLLLSTVSGSAFSDSSTNGYTFTSSSSANWNSSSPFATGGGFKRRVYIYNSSGSITF